MHMKKKKEGTDLKDCENCLKLDYLELTGELLEELLYFIYSGHFKRALELKRIPALLQAEEMVLSIARQLTTPP